MDKDYHTLISSYKSRYIHNKAILEGSINGQPADILLDNGSDVTIMSKVLLMKMCPDIMLELLAVPKLITGFSKDKGSQAEALCVMEFAVVQIKVLYLSFDFPILCWPGRMDHAIMGNDSLKLFNLTVNVTTSIISLHMNSQLVGYYIDMTTPDLKEKASQYISLLCERATKKGMYISQVLRGLRTESNLG